MTTRSPWGMIWVPPMGLSLLALTSIFFLSLTDGAILRYTVEKTTNAQCINSQDDHWCKYEHDIASQEGSRFAFASRYDDSPVQDFSGMYIPFFSVASMPVYVTSNGFLSFTEAAMCSYFCNSRAYNTLVGNYLFSADAATSTMRGGGGDWPMIGLYVCDLDPSVNHAEDLIVMSRVHYYDDVLFSQTVDYATVPLSRGSSGSGVLTAQVTMYSNGTIIMRYKSVPEGASASVGLILSETERIIVEKPSAENDISAYRFEPVFDICSTDDAATAEDCFDVGDECGWCKASSSCMATSAAANRCPTLEFIKKEPQPPAPAAVYGQQKFYDVSYTTNGRLAHGGSISYYNLAQYLRRSYAESSFSISLPFDFPYFTSRSSPTLFTRTLFLKPSGVFALTSAGRTQDCNPIWNACPNANYSHVLLPLQVPSDWTDTTVCEISKYGKQTYYSDVCATPPCPGRLLVDLWLEEDAFTYQKDRPRPSQRYSVQLYMDSNGIIEFNYGTSDGGHYHSMQVSYPKPQIGLVRNTIDDPSSVLIPWTRGQSRAGLRFTPASACRDCGMKGYCDEATANCVCAPGVVGEACDRCAPGFFGPSCTPCPTCLNYGVCNDGMQGEGGCQCSSRFAGPNCEMTCPFYAPSRCGECNFRNGYCACDGKCVCRNGWSGPSCNVPPSDPCRPFSLDGCPTCLQQPGCAYCFDSTCYSTKLAGKAGGYVCSYATTDAIDLRCGYLPQLRWVGFDFGIAIMLIFCGALLICAVLCGVVVYYVVLRRNVFDLHVAMAGAGVGMLPLLRRERQVMRTEFVPPKAAAHHLVSAIPLTQVPLRQLYDNQRSRLKKRRD